MRTAVRAAAWVLVFVALGAAVTSWFTPRPDLDAGQAEATAIGAFEEVGMEGVVSRPVERSQHAPSDGEPVDVWIVHLELDGDEVETRVLVDAGQLVYVDDRIGPDRQERLLTDDQFDTIAAYRHDATLDDWVLRNVAAAVAAALIAGVGLVIAKRSDRLWDDPASVAS